MGLRFFLIFFACILSVSLADDTSIVSCGSVLKLKHRETGHHLHSHSIAWGSGSGQQSVTGHGSNNDPGAMWVVKEPHQSAACEVGTAIECGRKIRLEHAQTGKNLHSHLFQSPVSAQQEVSAYGESGTGDTGDNWEVVCEAGKKYWLKSDSVQFKHSDTGKFLVTDMKYKFDQRNCGHSCPIMGQTEIACNSKSKSTDAKLRWISTQGVYFPANEGNGKSDEL